MKKIVFFGGVKVERDSEMYALAQGIAERVARDDKVVITGGGGGIMEAANRGAYLSGGRSEGIGTTELAQKSNGFFSPGGYVEFSSMEARERHLISEGDAFLFFPGGYGTLNELFAVLVSIRISKKSLVPVVLVGRSFWKEMLEWINRKLCGNGLITDRESKFVSSISDDMNEILEIIRCV